MLILNTNIKQKYYLIVEYEKFYYTIIKGNIHLATLR